MFLLPGNAVNRSAPLNRGLSFWCINLPNRFAGGGLTFRDSQGINHGTLTNGPTWSGLRPRGGWGSVKFDGTDDSVQFSSAYTALNVSGSMTVIASVYANSIASFPQVATKCDSAASTNRNYLLDLGNTGAARFAVYSGASGTTESVVSSSLTLSTGQWYRLAGTYDGATLTIYVDGVSKGTQAAAVTPSGTIGNLAFGQLGGTGSNRLNGYISDVKLYNARALSSSEVLQEFMASRRGFQNELNWQRYPVFDTQVAGAFNPAWAINSNAYIHLGV